MLNQIKKFLGIDLEHKKLFLRGFYELGKARLALDRKSFKDLMVGFEPNSRLVDSSQLNPAQRHVAHMTGWAVQTAARFTPWKSTCLVQVLAAQKILEKRGIGGVLFLGANTDKANPGIERLSAHAWLQCGSEIVTGESGHEKYTVVTCFSWGG